MKLLGWMHRKLKQNSYAAEVVQPTYGSATSFPFSGNPNYTTSYHEEAAAVAAEPFHGFLAIGTLGNSEALLFNNSSNVITDDEPPTPTFPTSSSLDHETTAQITDQDLKQMITMKIEKFLEAEEADNNDDYAQSSKRSSYASIITLASGSINNNYYDNKTQLQDDNNLIEYFPLQKYFFCSSVHDELKKQEADEELRDEKCSAGKNNKAHFAKRFMKKMMKNLTNYKSKIHAASPSSSINNINGASTESAAVSIKKKFPKVLKMLKKKIHPERFNNDDEKRVIPSKTDDNMGNNQDDGLMMTTSDDSNDSGISGGVITTENNEHWIKTDSEYLVLEL